MFNVTVLHLILAIPALILIATDKLSSKSQKGYQILFSILVPILGPVLMIIMGFYLRAKVSTRKSDVGDSADDHVRKHGPIIP